MAVERVTVIDSRPPVLPPIVKTRGEKTVLLTQRAGAMVPIIPSEVLSGSWELICCVLTTLSAALSYVLLWR